MTADRYVIYAIWCDAPGCDENYEGHPADSCHAVRKFAREQGWRASSPSGDFCPAHAEGGE